MNRLLVSLLLLASSVAAHANIVYNVNRVFAGGSITGTIETDGTLGAIGFGNFVNYNLSLASSNYSNGPTATINNLGAQHSYSYNGGTLNQADAVIQATATDLWFDASATGFHYILFWNDTQTHWWCLETQGCSNNRGESTGYGANLYAERNLTNQAFVFASNGNSVPEPGTLLLVGGALLALRRARSAIAR